MRVYYGRKTRYSGDLLAQELDAAGKSINWGYQGAGEINPASSIALTANKRQSRVIMRRRGVPMPRYMSHPIEIEQAIAQGIRLIGRPDHHFGGHGWYFCRTMNGVHRAQRKGATHFMEFIPNAREFRVHIVNGKSIKIAEKIGEGNRKNFKNGAYFAYPQNFNHKKTLRRIARKAVMSLELDFGAVDVLYKDGKYYVLEVNSAPSLTSMSDTLERYVRAFKENYGVNEESYTND